MSTAKKSGLPANVSREVSRHGQIRYYYRKAGRRTRLLGEPSDPQFIASLEAAKQGAVARRNGAVLSYVYFLAYGRQRVKIGVSSNLKRRIAVLQTGVPGASKIFYTTPGDSRLERHLHRMFAEDRISGEWFQFSAAIRNWIDADKARRAAERGVLATQRQRTAKEHTLSHPELSHPIPQG